VKGEFPIGASQSEKRGSGKACLPFNLRKGGERKNHLSLKKSKSIGTERMVVLLSHCEKKKPFPLACAETRPGQRDRGSG